MAKEKFCTNFPLKIEASMDGTKCTKQDSPPNKINCKLVEDPLILVLSSDEDEDERQSDLDSTMPSKQLLSGSQSVSNDSSAFDASDPAETSSDIIPKEEDGCLDVNKGQHSLGVRGDSREMYLKAIIDGSMSGSYMLLQCHSIMIGSYKAIPREQVILSTIGIQIAVPSLKDGDTNVTLSIDINEIWKVLIHFGPRMPVLFFYTMPTAATRIRNLLKMKSKAHPYYDPTSLDDTHRRITLLPERLNEDSKVSFKSIFGNINILDELNYEEANDILVRTSHREEQNEIKKAIGISAVKGSNKVQTILIYPPPPAKGGIPINTKDYACLGKNQFLNDVIIDFYLKYLTLSVLSKQDQSRTHVFSSFFYKRLTMPPVKFDSSTHRVEDNSKLSPAEKRHSQVKSWTKNVNLFDKDFIIIPINERSHWFLAIICFPGLMGYVQMLKNSSVVQSLKKSNKINIKKVADTNILGKSMLIRSKTITSLKTTTDTSEECSAQSQVEGNDEDMEGITGEEEEEEEEEKDNGSHPSKPANKIKHKLLIDFPQEQPLKYDAKAKVAKPVGNPIQQPYILIFDSLAGTSRMHVVETLRDYLRIEYKVKEGKECDFSMGTIKGFCPKVPQQTNSTDCGLYVLQYVESFFQYPVKDYHLPMQPLANWFSEEVVSRKREELQKLLLNLMEQNNVNIENLNLPKLTFSGTQQEMSSAYLSKSNNEEPTQDKTMKGNLVFMCAKEEESNRTVDEVELTTLPSLNSSDLNINTDELTSTQKANSERRTLVNYSYHENGSDMVVGTEPPVMFSTRDSEKYNTMLYLKAKKIDRNIVKEFDEKSPKRMRAAESVPKCSFR